MNDQGLQHMRLRVGVLLLVLLNGLFFVWQQGLLQAWGIGPASVQEPQRLQQQIKPDNVQLETARSPEPPPISPSGTHP